MVNWDWLIGNRNREVTVREGIDGVAAQSVVLQRCVTALGCRWFGVGVMVMINRMGLAGCAGF